jgi:hypothetical protein
MDQPGLNRLRVQDRDELSTLLTVLHGAMNALHRDECGDWTIAASRGHIRACDGTFHVYVRCRSPMHWTYAKRQLAGFATVYQDGDDEGVLVLPDAGRKRSGNAAALHRPAPDPRGVPEAIQSVKDAHRKGRSALHIA